MSEWDANVHGYNVNASQAQQWANNVFKRLWWSGLRSRFTAVDWYGDDSQLANDVSPNYYINQKYDGDIPSIGGVTFLYYLNPSSLDRNLEYKTGSNLNPAEPNPADGHFKP